MTAPSAERWTASARTVFTRGGGAWTQQAYLKAPNTQSGDSFGTAVAISANGNTVAVDAPGKDLQSGAAFLFERFAAAWTALPMIKASNSTASDAFGTAVTLSGDANTLAVGAPMEDANGLYLAIDSGAVYVFRRAGGWAEAAYLKGWAPMWASLNFNFGTGLGLSSDGNTLVVGSPGAVGNAQKAGTGAAHAFTFGTQWTLSTILHASNGDNFDGFGEAAAISADGSTIVIGMSREDSSGAQLDNSAQDTGAAYVFRLAAGTWTQLKYLKARDGWTWIRAFTESASFVFGSRFRKSSHAEVWPSHGKTAIF